MPLIFPSICSPNNNNNFAPNNNKANRTITTTIAEDTMNANDNSELANKYRQKLMELEAALLQSSEFRRELKENANQAQFDIRQAVDQQVVLLRERENELLQQINSMVTKKEDLLAGQLEKLNQAIGGCKLMLEYLKDKDVHLDETALDDLLERFSLTEFLQNCPMDKANAHISFESALKAEELQRQIVTFGRIKEEKRAQNESMAWLNQTRNNNNLSYSSSNSSTTQIDDQQQFECLRDRVTSTASSFDVIGNHGGSTLATNQIQNAFTTHFDDLNRLSIDHWLKFPGSRPKNNPIRAMSPFINQQQQGEMELDVKNQRQRTRSFTQEMEIGNTNGFNVKWAYTEADNSCWLKTSPKKPYYTSCGAVVTSILSSTPENWLSSNVNSSAESPPYIPYTKNSHKMSTNSQNKRKRSDTLNSIQSSLLSMEEEKEEHIDEDTENVAIDEAVKKLSECFGSKQIFPKAEKLDEDDKMDYLQNETCGAKKYSLELPNDPSFWLKKYPLPKQNRPMNEISENLSSWESVLGWKSILEKIHASGEDEWLAPSSRAIKI